jgi:PAS domain S-box-containing protein
LQWLKDTEGRFLMVNKAFATACGRGDPEHVHGLTDLDIWPKELAEKYRHDDQRVMSTGNASMVEEMIFIGNSHVWYETFKTPVRNDKDQVIGTTGFARDITERKRAEETLLASEVRYRRLFEAARDGILILDAETGMVMDVNPFLIEKLGFSHEAFLGKKVWELGFFKDIFTNQTNFAELQKKEYIRYENLPLETADGRRLDVEFVSNVYQVNHRKVIQCNIRDITERKLAEEVLRRSREEFKNLFDIAPVGFHELDTDGRIVRINQTELKMLGYSAEELLGQFIWKISAEEETSRRTVLAKLAGEMPPAEGFERLFRRKDGSTFPVLISDRLLKREDGAIIGIHGAVQDITERKHAEDEIKTILRTTMDGFYLVDKAGRFLDTNDAYCRMIGYSREELLKMAIKDIEAIDTDEVIKKRIQQIMDTGYSCFETKHRCKDGKVIIIEASVTALKDGEEKLVVFMRDITERKQAEVALRESKASLEFAQSITRMGNWDLDLATGKGQWSKEMFHLFDRDPALGEPHFTDFLEMVHPEDRTRLMEAHQQVAESGEQCQQEFRTNPARGPICHFNAIIQAIKESSGPVRRMAGTVQDITERKQAEERIREQAALLNAANDAIYVQSLDDTVTYWNDGAKRLYGWTPAEALGRKIHDLIKYDRDAFETAKAALLDQDNWSGEFQTTCKANKTFTVFCRWTLLRDESGHPNEVLSINTDITERKQLESNFLRAQRMEGIGALAGGIAHDLNNILQPILMTAPLLRETTGDPETRGMLDTVENCAQRGADIIKQLLTFARGKPSARVPLPVRHLLNEMSNLIHETFPKNIQLRVNVPKDLWQVLGDATQIHQALMNLCVNARDAMPNGGTLTLTAGNLTLDEAFAVMMPSAKPGTHVCVSVADTGMGIPPEHLDRIFDPFFTTKEIGKGTGLGLATVLGIAHGHGGFVRVNSQAGKGTIFELYLPASPETKAAVLSERETLPPRANGELILVVDDEADVCGVVRRILEKHGYRVLTAAEGSEAMDLFAQHRAEVRAVLTDMMMPEMDGPSLVRTLRHLAPQLPILGMTGVGEKADIKGLDTLDLLVLLTKPFNIIGLLDILHQALATPRKAQGKDAK